MLAQIMPPPVGVAKVVLVSSKWKIRPSISPARHLNTRNQSRENKTEAVEYPTRHFASEPLHRCASGRRCRHQSAAIVQRGPPSFHRHQISLPSASHQPPQRLNTVDHADLSARRGRKFSGELSSVKVLGLRCACRRRRTYVALVSIRPLPASG